jgi:hypothetical protein
MRLDARGLPGADLADVTANALDFDRKFQVYLSHDVIDLLGKMLWNDPAQNIDIRWLQWVRGIVSN